MSTLKRLLCVFLCCFVLVGIMTAHVFALGKDEQNTAVVKTLNDSYADGNNIVSRDADLGIKPGMLLGDANGDGEVDTIDAMLALQYATYLIEGDTLELAAYDVNGDGVVDTIDAMLILQYATYLIDIFPAEDL